MESFVSVIIPNYQGAGTIAKCLEAVLASRYQNFELIVVDDCSQDNSIEIIKAFPCKLIRLHAHGGVSQARNMGASQSKGDILFFTDSDCLLQQDTLSIINRTLSVTNQTVADQTVANQSMVIGGTYTRIPFDNNFFGLFQSVFINYSETRGMHQPDYIAGHAMVIDAQIFKKNGGFTEHFMPILEDVDFSHRLRQAGYRLVINPAIQVQHIFNFSLLGSLHNAVRKSMYWTIYSLNYGDVLVDSGTASIGLKINVLAFLSVISFLLAFIITGNYNYLGFVPFILAVDLFVNRGLVMAFYHSKGLSFTLAATSYYLFIYSMAVGLGALAGIVRYFPTMRALREKI